MSRLILSYIFTSSSLWIFSFLMPLLFLSAKAPPLLITTAYAVAFSSYLIVTPFAGGLCDRFNKKMMLLLGELLASLSIAIIAIMPINSTTTPLILLLTFIAASAGVMHHPTFQSIIPSVVHPDFREKFNAKINGIDNVVNILAPLGAGSLLILMNHQQVLLSCIALNCISYLIITYLNYQHFSDKWHPDFPGGALWEKDTFVWSG
ncbi:MAG: MFS transporter [Neisseriales bacterium]|nr:MAG: MFS transporter [Neisseriales bacterium]